MTFLWRVVAGLALGIVTGLFLGEEAHPLAIVAEGFVKLLQMAVLPYVTVSIIGSIGALRVEDLRRLGFRSALVLLGLWALALTFALLTPLTFPPTESASFFSTTLLEPAAPFDLVDLYIPANPFFALANNIVPAVVFFSIVVGVALMGVPRKHVLLDILETAGQALASAMRSIARLTPFGVFAIAATTAGTLRLEQAGQLQVYLMAYGGLSLLLALWVLPGLVGALTPVPARAIFGATHEALLTAAVAGDLFIVLPVLIAASKTLVAEHALATPQGRSLPDVIVPVSFNLPHSGKLLSVSFILFAGWISDSPIDPSDYPRLGLTSLVSLFGSITAAVPFLLDLFHVPADTFQLFIASGVLNSRFGTLVAAMHTVTIAIVGTCAAIGALRWRPAVIVRYVVMTAVLTAGLIGGLRLLAGALLAHPPSTADVLAGMTLSERVEATVQRHAAPSAPAPPVGTRLQAIGPGHPLRACYLDDALPFAFFNRDGDLVGLDAALVHQLARELKTSLQFVPLDRESVDRPDGAAARLQAGDCDIVIGGLAVTTSRTRLMELSTPYMEETLAFVVPDGDRRRFESWGAIQARGALTIAVPDIDYYDDMLARRLPHARLIRVRGVEAMFARHAVHADAIALPAERGSAWTLLHPSYAVVVPSPDRIRVPLAFALPAGETELARVVNTWLDLKRHDGTIDRLYQYWILGRSPTPVSRRWSIMRDVLHWRN